jgi:hypothetical protein
VGQQPAARPPLVFTQISFDLDVSRQGICVCIRLHRERTAGSASFRASIRLVSASLCTSLLESPTTRRRREARPTEGRPRSMSTQRHTPPRATSGAAEHSAESEATGRASRRLRQHCALARERAARLLSHDSTEARLGARSIARASRGRSPPGVNGGRGVGAPQPPERTPRVHANELHRRSSSGRL